MELQLCEEKPTAAAVAGMGALRSPEGVAFRVWAPHAQSVSVVGSFNDWDPAKNVLQAEDNGNWFGVVPDAKAGDAYRYSIRHGDAEFTRIDPWARKVTNSSGNGIIWWPDPAIAGPRFHRAGQNELIVYELHAGSFNAKKARVKPGTFATVSEKLPYLRDLGVNAIEIMPIAEFSGDFSWGYNPAHPFAVESAYGGPEGFQRFVRAAHEHGIAVILDVVYNHFGPGDLSLWQFDGWSENNLGGIYFYNDWKSKTPWGDSRPDYGRAEVRTYIHDNALMWLRDFGVDGLRLDMSVFIRTVHGNPGDSGNELAEGWSLLKWINDDIKKEFPEAFTVAEDLQNSEWLVKNTSDGGAGFNAQWDAAFVHPVRSVLITQEDADRNLDSVIAALKNAYDGDSFKRVVYSESHDEVANGKARLPSEIAPENADGYFAKKRSILGAGLTLTAPAVPMLFQGQEFLEDEWFRDSVPLDWSKLETFKGMHALYRDLISLRSNRHGVSKGLTGAYLNSHHVNHPGKVLGYHRRYDGGPGDDVVVIINFSHEPLLGYAVGVPFGGTWHTRFNSDGQRYSKDFSDHPSDDLAAAEEPLDGMPWRVLTGLAPYSMVILSQNP